MKTTVKGNALEKPEILELEQQLRNSERQKSGNDIKSHRDKADLRAAAFEGVACGLSTGVWRAWPLATPSKHGGMLATEYR